MESNQELQKKFKYSKGELEVSFVVRIDIKTQLNDLKNILEQAIKDVDQEINNP